MDKAVVRSFFPSARIAWRICRRTGSAIAHLTVLAGLLMPLEAGASDWPMWGRDPSRNMASQAVNMPVEFSLGRFLPESEEVDMKTTKGVLWVAKLGSQTYGNPTVAGGKVFVGTNNESPRDSDITEDRGVVMCFRESDGAFLWQLSAPKLGAGKVSDWEYIGICSSPTVIDDRAYLVTNRGEVVCMDVEGMVDGNDGPFTDEAGYMRGPGKPPVMIGATDADIVWRFDMRDELGVFPHNISSCSVLVVNDLVYATTSNGVDWSHINIPAPFAPSFIALDRHTGALAGEENSGVSSRSLHAGWSSPAYGTVQGNGMVIWGGSDGWSYGYRPEPLPPEDGFQYLSELWRYDCNPPSYRSKDGKPLRYATYEGPSEVIATPVFYKNRVYIAIGQDPEHGDGYGQLSCIDVTKRGDISQNGAVWTYRDIGRTISTVSIADGFLYAAEYDGDIHCLDADTGEVHWVHRTNSRIWGSTLVVDNKVYIGNEDGDLVILKAGKTYELLNTVHFGTPIYSTAIEAGGVLYVATQTHLYAIGNREN